MLRRCLVFIMMAALLSPSLHLSVDAGNWLQGGGTLLFGEPVTGSLDNSVFRQIYTFSAQANDIISIVMSRASGDLDPYVLLTDGQGAILAVSDDHGSGVDAQITSYQVSADGQYFAIATRFGQELGSTNGDYTLVLDRANTASGTQTTSVNYGDTILGLITPEQPLIFYFLRAERGDVVNISLRRTSGNLDPLLHLATSDGRILASNDDDPEAAGTLDAGIYNYIIFESGVYLVVVTRFGEEAGDTDGSYVLTVNQTPPEELGTTFEEARLIDYGESLEGTIDDEIPIRYYRFEAERGDVVTVVLSNASGNLDPLVKLASMDQTELVQDDDSGDDRGALIAAYTIPTAGTYYAVATRAGGIEGQTTGTFVIELNGRPGIGGGQALEIQYGASISGLIGDQIASEEYVFMGQEGDVIRISMNRASGNLDPLVTLFDSERKQITFDDDGGGEQNALIQQFVLPRDDMYILLASRYDREAGTTSGAYLLTLELIRPGGAN
jgi:hypothetical protein